MEPTGKLRTDASAKTVLAPKWLCRASGLLAGWLVLLMGTFLIAIGTTALLSLFNIAVFVGGAAFIVLVAGALLVSGICAYWIARGTSKWLRSRGPRTAYAVFCLLVALAALVLPVPFMFVVV